MRSILNMLLLTFALLFLLENISPIYAWVHRMLLSSSDAALRIYSVCSGYSSQS